MSLPSKDLHLSGCLLVPRMFAVTACGPKSMLTRLELLWAHRTGYVTWVVVTPFCACISAGCSVCGSLPAPACRQDHFCTLCSASSSTQSGRCGFIEMLFLWKVVKKALPSFRHVSQRDRVILGILPVLVCFCCCGSCFVSDCTLLKDRQVSLRNTKATTGNRQTKTKQTGFLTTHSF